jgi:hypothetical protein
MELGEWYRRGAQQGMRAGLQPRPLPEALRQRFAGIE